MRQSCNSSANTFSQKREEEDTLVLKMLTGSSGNRSNPPLHGQVEQEQQAGSSSTPGCSETLF